MTVTGQFLADSPTNDTGRILAFPWDFSTMMAGLVLVPDGPAADHLGVN